MSRIILLVERAVVAMDLNKDQNFAQRCAKF
jgi:hypothetical protein